MNRLSAKEVRRLSARAVSELSLRLLPARMRLAAEFHSYTILAGWEPECRQLHRYARPSSTAIDVGANMGLWTYAMAASGLFRRVLAFEPNPAVTGLLQAAARPDVQLVQKAASNATGRAVLRVPLQGRMPLNGWASLESGVDTPGDGSKAFAVPTIRLDDLGLEDVGFIKIDVEGHELAVLDGARHLFTRCRPVCVIESKPQALARVDDYFASLRANYDRVDTQALHGFRLSPDNHLYVPRPSPWLRTHG